MDLEELRKQLLYKSQNHNLPTSQDLIGDMSVEKAQMLLDIQKASTPTLSYEYKNGRYIIFLQYGWFMGKRYTFSEP